MDMQLASVVGVAEIRLEDEFPGCASLWTGTVYECVELGEGEDRTM
jgi:hypothetical protein